jgi:hypothetical protein
MSTLQFRPFHSNHLRICVGAQNSRLLYVISVTSQHLLWTVTEITLWWATAAPPPSWSRGCAVQPFTVYPLINGLSDHDAQVINLSNLLNINPKIHYTFKRRINSNSTCIFLEDNVNTIFNNFLNIYIRIFNASFPVVKSKESTKSNRWLTTGIRISCTTKRNLYVSYRNSMDPNYKAYYKKYCKILSSVIRAAKKCTLTH